MMLLSGDLFDGPYDAESISALKSALEEAAVPVFISPGNHDFVAVSSPWLTQSWPKNVHIFTEPAIGWVDVPSLGCRVYGAGFTSMDCSSLLEGFRAEPGIPSFGVFHGDPTQVNSPYNPVSKGQVAKSGLRYLALGHVHKDDGFWAGDTLCAWPGCPMGRGWDEGGEKGVLIVSLDKEIQVRFAPLDGPKFFDLTLEGTDPAAVLPAVANEDFYRVTLTGEAESVDLDALQAEFAAFPNLILRDQTVRPLDIWAGAGEDSFEGAYFGMLRDALENAEEDKDTILLAAKLSRQLLEGQEVKLP
jgi:DNA repair exonuclease SbcCD nuclease subunit